MMYIINPIWFYLMSVVDNARGACFILLVVLLGTAGVCAFETTTCCVNDEKKWISRAKKCVVFAIVCLICAIFIPSKSTLMQIMIAKYATYENADSAIQAIKSAADYVIEAAGKLK